MLSMSAQTLIAHCNNTYTWTCSIDHMVTCRVCNASLSVLDCPSPAKLEHGAVTTLKIYTYNTNVSFQCDPGYQLDGQESLTCREGGQWSGCQPTCKGTCSTSVNSMVKLNIASYYMQNSSPTPYV